MEGYVMRDTSQAVGLVDARNQNWADFRVFVQQFGAQICKLVNAATGASGAANIEPAGKYYLYTLYKLTVGSQAFDIQYFRPGSSLSDLAFNRLSGMMKVGQDDQLFQRHIGFIDEHMILIAQANGGPALSEKIATDSVDAWSRALGRWHGAISQKAPRRTASGTMYNYLRHLYRGEKHDVDEHRDFLQSLPVLEEVLVNTNSRLSHYTCLSDGQVCLTKPTAFRMMPLAWGLLESGLALSKRFPDHIEQIVDGLVQGWAEGGGQSNWEHATFREIVKVFCTIEPDTRHIHESHLAQGYLDAFNSTRGREEPRVELAFQSPHFDVKLKQPTKTAIKALRSRLIDIQCAPQIVEAEGQRPDEPIEPKVRSAAQSNPSNALGALCGACSGYCCQFGLQNHAYLKASDLAAFSETRPDLDHEGIADAYIDKIKSRHARNGCLFQGSKGCSLPRDMRSQTCNAYLCGSARQVLANEARLQKSKARVLFVAGSKGAPTLWSDTKTKPLSDA
jgi:hypothetical protein